MKNYRVFAALTILFITILSVILLINASQNDSLTDDEYAVYTIEEKNKLHNYKYGAAKMPQKLFNKAPVK